MNQSKELSGLSLILSAIAVGLASFFISLDYSIANVSIPYIAGDLAVAPDQGTYVITSFAVGNAIALPISGWLTKRVGMIRLITLSLLGFVLFSWVCGISQTLTMLVIARFFQGFAAGPMIPISQTLSVEIFPEKKRTLALGIWSSIVVAGPVFGPVIGGWISYDYSWPWIFFINIPIGLLCAFIIRYNLKGFETPKIRLPPDWIGLILLAIFVTCLQFLLDKGEQFDWLRSPIIVTCMITSFLAFVYLIVWELTHKNPLLELRLLKIRSFGLSLILIGTIYAVYFGTVILIPLWLQEYMGYTSTWAGLAVAPMGILPFLLSSLLAKFIPKTGPLIPLGISLILFAAASFITAYFTTNVDFTHVVLSRLLLGAAFLFFVFPLFVLSMKDLTNQQLPSAAGIFHFVRAMSGGIGTAIFTTLWQRRSAFHHSNIVTQINESRESTTMLFDKLDQLTITGESANALVNEMATRQGAMLGLNDCFYLMGWIFIGLLAILFLGKKKKQAQKT